jgi:hypothetical protein
MDNHASFMINELQRIDKEASIRFGAKQTPSAYIGQYVGFLDIPMMWDSYKATIQREKTTWIINDFRYDVPLFEGYILPSLSIFLIKYYNK